MLPYPRLAAVVFGYYSGVQSLHYLLYIVFIKQKIDLLFLDMVWILCKYGPGSFPKWDINPSGKPSAFGYDTVSVYGYMIYI